MDTDPIDPVRVDALTVSTTRRTMTAHTVDDGSGEQFDDVEVMQPAGLMANPAITQTLELVGVRRGDELIGLALVDKGAAAQAVPVGEVWLFGVGAGNAGSGVRIRASGAVDVPATAVNLMDASQSFVRGQDLATALAAFIPGTSTIIAAVQAALAAINTYAVAIQPIADPTSTATNTLTTALTTTFSNAQTTFNNAATAMVNSSTTYLSTVIKGQ